MARRASQSQTGQSQTEPAQIDVHIGNQIRLRRMLLGMTQEDLSASLGVSYQQVGLYERGTNRVNASRLYAFSQALAVPLEYFFEGLPQLAKRPQEGISNGLLEQDVHVAGAPDARRDGRTQRDALEILRAYGRLADPGDRKRVLDLLRRLAASGS